MKGSKGEQLGKDMSNKDILIAPGDDTFGSPGYVVLDATDPDFVPRAFRNDYPSEVPVPGPWPFDSYSIAAVVVGHELGHAVYDADDPENVIDNENPVRRGLGIPERKTYHGLSLCGRE